MLPAALFAVSMAVAQVHAERPAEAAFQLEEESPDVFLAKVTLQQYLSRVVRRDWDGAKRLTHPKTLQAILQGRRRAATEGYGLAPWADADAQLKTFRFVAARQIAPGVVAIQVGEESARRSHARLASDDAVYLLFKSRGSFLIGDKRPSAEVEEVTSDSIRHSYPSYVDAQVQAQARRDSGLHDGHHR
jgi:hypothetical protein